MLDIIISRTQAKSIRAKYYHTGELCNNNHFSPRYVRNGQCCKCSQIAMVNNHVKAKEKREKGTPDQEFAKLMKGSKFIDFVPKNKVFNNSVLSYSRDMTI